jgi:eukaryotic-like serine/threonine-protein kinase
MDSNVDTLFIQMAEAKGYLDPPHAEEALKLQKMDAVAGEKHLVRDIVLEKGWMTDDQVADIEEQIAGGWEKTGKIEGYKLLTKVGQGGMGAVYKAERIETGELCALKILPSRMAERGDFVERFLREARAASKMRSEHIVRAVDVGISGGYYYFAMEFVEGESVDTTISIDGSMAESKVLKIVHQMALALVDAEKTGMVHRDIKPGNIIVTEDGHAKLTDFGLAREAADQSMTETGMTLGTPNYMSPEQARAVKSLDTRSDIYSLGVTLYHMLTGVVPFQGETSLLTMLKHLNEPPVAPITRRSDLSPGCNAVCLKMLAKDRNDRYRHARELAEDLKLVIDGKPPQHAQTDEPEPDQEGAPAVPGPQLDRFAEEVRKQGRLKWIKVGSILFALLLAGIVVNKLMPDGGPDDGPKNGSGEGVEAARREKAARAQLQKAKAYAAANPKKLAAIVAAFREVEVEYGKTKVYSDARRLRGFAQRKLDMAVKKALQTWRARARARADEDQFREALAVYDTFPVDLRNKEANRRIDAERRTLQENAWARFKTLRQKAEGYLGLRKFVTARDAIEPATKFGISGIATEARRLLARIQQESVAAASVRTGEVFRAYQEAAAKVRAFIRRGMFAPGLAELDRQKRQTTRTEVRDMLTQSRSTIFMCRKVWDAALVGLAALPADTPVTIGTISGKFIKLDPKTQRVHLRIRGKKIARVSPGWLPSRMLRDFAAIGSKNQLKPIHYAAFFIARGEYPQAATELQKAREQKASPMLIKRYTQQLALLQTSREEIEAENLYSRAKEQTGTTVTEHEQRARTLWELVARYAHTQLYTRSRAEIETMLARSEAESITVDTLFAVAPVDAGGGTSELKYDFFDLAQSRDWLTVWKQQPHGRWPIRPVYGEMSCDKGLVYFKVPLRGNYRVEVQAKDLRTGSIRFSMPEPSASPRAAGMSFNWTRTANGAESTLEAAGKILGAKRTMPGFQVVGSVALAVEVKDGTVSAYAGGRLAHREKAKADSGYLVLAGVNTGARLTSVTIRCTLDREWLDKAFVQPLRAAKREEARWRMATYKQLLLAADAADWRKQGPDKAWTVAKGYAIAREGVDCKMTTGDMNWRDYVFAAKVLTGTAPGDVWLMVRWADVGAGGKGYVVNLAAGRGATGSGGRVRLSKVDGARIETLKEVPVDLTGFEWHAFFVEVRGPRIRVLMGARELINVEDKVHTAGRVGLASFKCGARFNDVKVKLMK